jgi:hypothetical protein
MAQSLTRGCAFKNTRISSLRIVYGQYSRIGHKVSATKPAATPSTPGPTSRHAMSVAAVPLDRQEQTAPS